MSQALFSADAAVSNTRPTLLPDDVAMPDAPREIYSVQSQARNEELHAAVKLSCGSIYPLREELAEQLREWKARWQSWCGDNTRRVDDFQEQLRFFSKTPYTSEKLDGAYACHLPSSWLEQYLAPLRQQEELEGLRSAPLSVRHPESARQRNEGDAAAAANTGVTATPPQKRLFDEDPRLALRSGGRAAGEAVLGASATSASAIGAMTHRQAHNILEREFLGPVRRVDMEGRVGSIHRQMFPLDGGAFVGTTFDTHDNGQADPLSLLRAEFAKSFAIVSSQEGQLQRAIEEREGLLRDERVGEAELRTRTIVDGLTDLVHINYSRFKQSVLAGVDVADFAAHVEDTKRAMAERSTLARQDADATIQKATQDLENLADYMQKRRTAAQQQQDLFSNQRTEFSSGLKRNTDAQLEAWRIIEQQLAQLQSLCEDREGLIGRHVEATEKERERQQLHDEVMAAAEARRLDLEAVTKNATDALDYVASAERLSAAVANAVQRKAFPSKLQSMQIEEGLRFCDVYRRFSLFAGRVLFLKQQRLENIRRLVRATEFQVQAAVETLDTDLPRYREQLRELLVTQDMLGGESGAMDDALQRETALWDEVEAFLDSKGVEIERPPTLAVQELRRDMLRAHVEAVDHVTVSEQKLLDQEKAHVRKITNACVAAREMFDEKRARANTSVGSGGGNTSATGSPQRFGAERNSS